ncbi:hypothetical protein CAPTEDRAFT_20972 [Capitella teleta]|uniref:Phospholipid/glycerol acyltransferase domain-containing protein n=1 Tax=Capitella teleta TaxID=283909 RepID=R7UVU9_CAPTE|nr:hypothetical protein CAPTEDRAFT_20972 [Capitella teleta]|eukprot:ELU10392.1 hypothetical protein CAPTEDRAFT_20972 [Capitella teleta]
MGGWWGWMKANFLPLHILIGYVFVVSGLIVCGLMALTYLLVWPWNRQLYRKIVMNLAYTHWCQFTFLGQWWAGCNCTLHLDNKDDLKYIGHEHVVALMNHKYDIDWLMAWLLSERFAMLGGTKIYGKSSLKMVPLIGWAWTFTESIFLKRNWDKDKEIISRDLAYIRDYPDGYSITLLLFCEGTRFTDDKHKASMEVAKAKGLPLLKHHLLPRTRGFIHTVHGLKGKVPAILDLTVAFRKDGAEPTLMNVLQGRACKAEMYCRRIPLDSVPTNTDQECADWVQKVFREKDEVYDDFYRNGKFTRGVKTEIPLRVNDMVVWFMWTIVLCVPLYYYIVSLIMTGSYATLFWAIVIIAVFAIILRLMIAVSEIKSHGSSYGKKDD